MHNLLKLCSAGIVFTVAMVCLLGTAQSQNSGWSAVDAAIREGRPKTAIELLNPIIEDALTRKAYPETVKGIVRRIKLEGNIQGRKAEERIVRLQAELAEAPDEMKPVLETVLGYWYWHYFKQNRWHFMKRTQTSGPAGEDILSWDLARIFAEIDKHFTAALSAKSILQQIPVTAWDDLLVKGNVPDEFRPTLYDFLAHQALDFYMAAEQASARRQDAFDLSAESSIFDDSDRFLNWTIKTTDDESNIVKALRTAQDLMRYHEADDDPSAFIDVDLLRLQYGYEKAFGSEKDERYKVALTRFVKENADHRISARALAALARVVQGEGDLVKAHRLASRGARLFPKTPGGADCHNIIQQIEARSSQLSAERVWTAPWPKVAVTYRNLNKVYLRIVKYEWEDLLSHNRWNWETLGQKERKALLKKEPIRDWSVTLPATADYQERRELLSVPEDLQPGFYYLISSHKPDFGENDNMVNYTGFWVSKLALVMREQRGAGEVQGFVLDARLGLPVKGVRIRSWWKDKRGRKQAGPSAVTDTNGLFRIDSDNRRQYWVLASHGEQQVSSLAGSQALRWHAASPNTQTLFFTDRSIYRPGQTIRYKGLCIRVDTEADSYKTIGGQATTVVFRDVNNKEIARQEVKANAYGSFTGSFTAPSDRLTGQMRIMVEGQPHSQAHFSVEEYKRPKFKVTLDALTVPARLDDEVS